MDGAAGLAGAPRSRILVDFVGGLAIRAGETRSLHGGLKPLFWLPPSVEKQRRRNRQNMRHIIAIHLQNEAGALTRVTGLFSTRGYNIESLSVAATDDPSVSRVTLVTKGADGVILQIVNQLNKLIDVVAVEDLTRGEHMQRE